MLQPCPECELQVSDKAITCPHCGYPLKEQIVRNRISKKHKALPNGFGQISFIKNQNLRKPYRAMVTVGMKPNGRPRCQILKPQGYFETYNEAYAALVEYNKNPYDLDADITVQELYEKWSERYFETIQSNGIRNITSAWKYCSTLYNVPAKTIRARHIKTCMEEAFITIKGEKRMASAGIKMRIKSLFNLMFDYAVEYEIVERNYARTFDVGKDVIQEKEELKRGHVSFSEKEMEILWGSINQVPYVNIILFQCYTGWRPQELGLIELDHVDLEQMTIRGGLKTDAGRNRIVPIHPEIIDIVHEFYDYAVKLKSKYLINCLDTVTHRGNYKLTYDKYSYRFERIVGQLKLNPDHRPHDPRKHFVTMAKKYKVDEYAIKYIVGHTITDITEKVYTQREIEWLHEEIRKIPCRNAGVGVM